jgi:hypothetical protein
VRARVYEITRAGGRKAPRKNDMNNFSWLFLHGAQQFRALAKSPFIPRTFRAIFPLGGGRPNIVRN